MIRSNEINEIENSLELPFELKNPLIFLDIEATGPDPQIDRIIEIHCLKFLPNKEKDSFYAQVNPTEKIPPESTLIHGFTNNDLSQAPSFKKIAKDLFSFFEGADFGGYNVARFDLRILFNEFKKIDIKFDLGRVKVIDPFQIYIKNNKRNLSTAYQHYCDKELTDAHGARADNIATIEVFLSQMKKHEDIPDSFDEIADYCVNAGSPYVDPERFLKWQFGEVILNSGKHKGRLLKEIVKEDHGFLFWVTKNNFHPVLIRIIKNALNGKFPEKPN
ncbi:MAG: DNA polymerase III subunit epsilon [Planctomycetota bacterium]|nr:MAG: DNA polymerase III subunit epsilon [Planctomycetota bacterium]